MSATMKVLMVYPEFVTSYRNGIVSVMNTLPEALKKKDCEVRTIQFTENRASGEADSRNILVYAEKANMRSRYRFASVVKKEASEGKYDIVHGHTVYSVLYKSLGSDVPACITNHGIGYKVYHYYWQYKATRDIHDFLPFLKYFPLKAYNIMGGRLLYNKADRLTTVSDFSKHEVSKIYGVPEEKIDSIPNGVPIDIFTPNVRKDEKDKIKERYNLEKALLCLPPVPRKGLHFVIKALPVILKEIPDFKLLVVGGIPLIDNYYKFCLKLAEKMQVKDKVVFVGWVDEIDLPRYYAAASAFVLPSSYEALSMTVLESMACGTPVCTSKSWGSSEIITEGEDGFLCDPMDNTSLTKALTTLLSDDELRKRMGFNARKKIESRYSWDNIAKQYIETYEKTIQSVR
jgi:glycosyltransferase involved in cell wall biosynthesis